MFNPVTFITIQGLKLASTEPYTKLPPYVVPLAKGTGYRKVVLTKRRTLGGCKFKALALLVPEYAGNDVKTMVQYLRRVCLPVSATIKKQQRNYDACRTRPAEQLDILLNQVANQHGIRRGRNGTPDQARAEREMTQEFTAAFKRYKKITMFFGTRAHELWSVDDLPVRRPYVAPYEY